MSNKLMCSNPSASRRECSHPENNLECPHCWAVMISTDTPPEYRKPTCFYAYRELTETMTKPEWTSTKEALPDVKHTLSYSFDSGEEDSVMSPIGKTEIYESDPVLVQARLGEKRKEIYIAVFVMCVRNEGETITEYWIDDQTRELELIVTDWMPLPDTGAEE